MPQEGDIVRNRRTGAMAVWRGGQPVPMDGGAAPAATPAAPVVRYGPPPVVDPYKAEDQQMQRQAADRADAQFRATQAREDRRFQLEREKFEASRKEKSTDAPYSQSALDAFDRAIASAERLKKHPGFGAAVGSGFDPQSWGSYNPLWGDGKALGGTNAANFEAQLDAMKAQVFLPMVQSMKGMGALSNAEGQKLTDAIGALDQRMSEDEFKASLDRIVGDLKSYRDRGKAPSPSQPRKRLRYNPATGELE